MLPSPVTLICHHYHCHCCCCTIAFWCCHCRHCPSLAIHPPAITITGGCYCCSLTVTIAHCICFIDGNKMLMNSDGGPIVTIGTINDKIITEEDVLCVERHIKSRINVSTLVGTPNSAFLLICLPFFKPPLCGLSQIFQDHVVIAVTSPVRFPCLGGCIIPVADF